MMRRCVGFAALALIVWQATMCRASQTAGPLAVLSCPDTLALSLRERFFATSMNADRAVSPAFRLSGQESEFGSEDRDQVNVTRAVGYSLLLPGAGQWYAGAKGRAGVFFVSEALCWTLFGYFRTVSGIKEDSYQSYARVHAGIDPAGKNDEFLRMLSFYDSRDAYNENGRLLDPGRPYYPDNPIWDWQWDEPAAMQRYRALRNQSHEADNRAKFVLGAAFANRLIAALDAWRTARSVNRRARMEASHWKVHLRGRPSLNHPAFTFMLSRQF